MQILYFGRLREVFGRSEENLVPPAELRERGGVWAEELAEDRSFRVAINQELATLEGALKADSEVAIFPPVTGG
jgi:molybdopterin synthase sulfur carrier subunit